MQCPVFSHAVSLPVESGPFWMGLIVRTGITGYSAAWQVPSVWVAPISQWPLISRASLVFHSFGLEVVCLHATITPTACCCGPLLLDAGDIGGEASAAPSPGYIHPA